MFRVELYASLRRRDRHAVDQFQGECAEEGWQGSVSTAQVLVHQRVQRLTVLGLKHVEGSLRIQLEHELIVLVIGIHTRDSGMRKVT